MDEIIPIRTRDSTQEKLAVLGHASRCAHRSERAIQSDRSLFSCKRHETHCRITDRYDLTVHAALPQHGHHHGQQGRSPDPALYPASPRVVFWARSCHSMYLDAVHL